MEVRYKKCDHCEEIINEMHDYDDYLIDLPYGDFRNVDLCKKCARELQLLVGKFIGKENSLGDDVKDEEAEY